MQTAFACSAQISRLRRGALIDLARAPVAQLDDVVGCRLGLLIRAASLCGSKVCRVCQASSPITVWRARAASAAAAAAAALAICWSAPRERERDILLQLSLLLLPSAPDIDCAIRLRAIDNDWLASFGKRASERERARARLPRPLRWQIVILCVSRAVVCAPLIRFEFAPAKTDRARPAKCSSRHCFD